MDIKNKDIIKVLFNNALCLKIILLPIPRRNPSREARYKSPTNDLPSIPLQLSPYSRSLLLSFSPETQKLLAKDFLKDDAYINSITNRLELDDPDYMYFNNSKVGTDLEYWVCVNIRCPGCGSELYKYANPSMPAVDVRCINQNHSLANGPKYYQIKTTEKDKQHNGYKYFSLEERYICTGSIRFGYNCHIMTYNDDYKDILIGYICLEYIYINQDTIRVDNATSFILIPNLLYQPTNIEEASATYYSYITNPLSKPMITFNPLMCNILTFNNTFDISLNTMYDARKIKIYNEEPPILPDFKSKYLIMKMKYLNLKKMLNYYH
jgi:hypothetical protein